MCLCWHCLPVPVRTSLSLPSDSGMPSNHHSDVAVVVTTYRVEKHELSLFCFGTKQDLTLQPSETCNLLPFVIGSELPELYRVSEDSLYSIYSQENQRRIIQSGQFFQQQAPRIHRECGPLHYLLKFSQSLVMHWNPAFNPICRETGIILGNVLNPTCKR